MPKDEPSLPTRALRRPSATATSQPPSSGGSARTTNPTPDLSLEALKNEERARLRVTAQIMVGIACLGLALAPPSAAILSPRTCSSAA